MPLVYMGEPEQSLLLPWFSQCFKGSEKTLLSSPNATQAFSFIDAHLYAWKGFQGFSTWQTTFSTPNVKNLWKTSINYPLT